MSSAPVALGHRCITPLDDKRPSFHGVEASFYVHAFILGLVDCSCGRGLLRILYFDELPGDGDCSEVGTRSGRDHPERSRLWHDPVAFVESFGAKGHRPDPVVGFKDDSADALDSTGLHLTHLRLDYFLDHHILNVIKEFTEDLIEQ